MKKLLVITSFILLLTLLFVACDTAKSTDETHDETYDEKTTGADHTPEITTAIYPELTEQSSEDISDPIDTSAATSAEETAKPQEIPPKATEFFVAFGNMYTQADRGSLFDGELNLKQNSDAAYFSGVAKNDWMEFCIHPEKNGEYSVCMVFGGTDGMSTYTVYVDGCKAATIKNKVSGSDSDTQTNSTDAKIHLTEGVHTVRVVMESDGPNLYGVRFALTRENISLNKPISSDGTENSQKEVGYANDGDPLTKWSAVSNREESLIIDLKDLYALDKIAFLFENSMGEYSISVSKDGSDYKTVCNGAASLAASSAFVKEYHLNGAMGRYVKITHATGEDATEQMFSIYEIYLYGELHVIPPTPEFYDDYRVPYSVWTVSGHCTGVVGREGHSLSGMVAAGGVESGGLLHRGAVGIGKIDLSKYDKVIVYYGLDNSSITQEYYNANPYNRIMLTKEDTDGSSSPDQSVIIASATYQLLGWSVVALEIDLSNINYNGSVYITYDTLPGTFMLIGGIEFIGSQKN